MQKIIVEFPPTVTPEILQVVLQFLPVSVKLVDAEKNYYEMKATDVMSFYHAGAACASAGLNSNQIV